MRLCRCFDLVIVLVLTNTSSLFSSTWAFQHPQEYDPDYEEYAVGGGDNNYLEEQDNLYYDYAQRKNTGGYDYDVAPVPDGGGIGRTIKVIATGIASYLMGATIHTHRFGKKMKRKHSSEQKQLYAQYYNDVYKLTEQNKKLESKIDELIEHLQQTEAKAELEALQRDYDEFKQPDIDGDDRISRAEFNMYVKNYLSNYPGLSEKDYPKFDDFDHDGDGYVSFREYSQQMALQAQQAELEELASGSAGDKQKAKAMNDLYKSTRSGDLYF